MLASLMVYSMMSVEATSSNRSHDRGHLLLNPRRDISCSSHKCPCCSYPLSQCKCNRQLLHLSNVLRFACRLLLPPGHSCIAHLPLQCLLRWPVLCCVQCEFCLTSFPFFNYSIPYYLIWIVPQTKPLYRCQGSTFLNDPMMEKQLVFWHHSHV